MTRTTSVLAFLVLAAIQLGVPLSMIVDREITLRQGHAMRFQTAPVDPYDAFRGKFVALRIEPENILVPPDITVSVKRPFYAALAADSNGFARVSALHTSAPADGDYVKVRVHWHSGTNAFIRYPFDRYYMNEQDAPRAELAYGRNSTRTNRNTYVIVRLRHGDAVIEDLIIDNQPVAKFLQREVSAP